MIVFALVLMMCRGADAQTFLCTADFCDPSHQPKPNIYAVMKGYHVLKGNPFAMGETHDPGFETTFIFKPTYKTENNEYALYPGVSANNRAGCVTTKESVIFHSVKEMRDSIAKSISMGTELASNLESEVSASYKGVGTKTKVPPIMSAAFSSSEDYVSNKNFFSNKKGITSVSEVECSVYEIMITKFNPPPFSQALIAGFKYLHESKVEERELRFRKFINDFGTHFIQKAVMGVRNAIMKRYDMDTARNSTDSEINECNKERMSLNLGLQVSHTKSACEKVGKSTNKDTSSEVEWEQISTYGSLIRGSQEEWAKQDFKSPLPIKMKLSPIINLLSSFYSKKYAHEYDAKKILEWVGPLYETYCDDNKQTLGIEVCDIGAKSGCGWSDNCKPKTQGCLDTNGGFQCCALKCPNRFHSVANPCLNGGVCKNVMLSYKCHYKCECVQGQWEGDQCEKRAFSASNLQSEMEKVMKKYHKSSNDEFRTFILNHLEKTYPDYCFSVNALRVGHSSNSISVRGQQVTVRDSSRTLVVGYTKKGEGYRTYNQAAIQKRILDAVTKKGLHAYQTVSKAEHAVQSNSDDPYVKMILAVRFGNGLRSDYNHNNVFFKNFVSAVTWGGWWGNTPTNHESSIVVMFTC